MVAANSCNGYPSLTPSMGTSPTHMHQHHEPILKQTQKKEPFAPPRLSHIFIMAI
jgi:hypothetical protein